MVSERGVFLRDTVEFGRAVNLIDAIFGFSLTLLVTTLEVPPVGEWRSLSDVLDGGLSEQLIAATISFVVVVGMWLTNHRVLASFRALDGPTIRICVYLVGLIIFIPFTTKAISDRNPEHLPLPTGVYAVHVTAIVLATLLLILVGRRRGLVDRPLSEPGLNAHLLAVAAIFLISIPIAYRFGPNAAQLSWLSIILVNPAVGFVARRRTG